jgi:quercetin dioxygenase-like cupin family protein
MRRMSQYALLLCVGCLGTTLIAAPATSNEVEITSEPDHHLTFENQYVRVFRVEVDPNTETEMHWHRHDYIAVTLGDAQVSNTVKDKPAVIVKLAEGDTRFSSGNFAHFVRDVAPQPFRNVTIEILQDESLRDRAAQGKVHWDEDRGLEILTNGTKEILFVKDGIRVTEFELRSGGVVPMHHHTGPHLLVAVSDLEMRSDVKSDTANGPQGPMSGHFKSGDSKWLPGGYSHTIANTGSRPAKFVTLEFP